MFPGIEVLEIFRLEREGYAAQDIKESAQHLPQQPQPEMVRLCRTCKRMNCISRCYYSKDECYRHTTA